jgi:hypothetical protein
MRAVKLEMSRYQVITSVLNVMTHRVTQRIASHAREAPTGNIIQWYALIPRKPDKKTGIQEIE